MTVALHEADWLDRLEAARQADEQTQRDLAAAILQPDSDQLPAEEA